MIINPIKYIDGKITAPTSKSAFIRHIAAATVSDEKNIFTFKNFNNDIVAALNTAKALQKNVTQNQNHVEISQKAVYNQKTYNCSESGLVFRMFAPIISVYNNNFKLISEGSLNKRSIKNIFDPLLQFGVNFFSENDFPPVNITGNLKAAKAEIDFEQSSQLLTGLLFALPLLNKNSEINAVNLKSKPYIDLTLEILKMHGIEIANNNYKYFYIKGNQKFKGISHTIEGDWSAVAFLAVAGAVGGKIEIQNINTSSFQADKKIIEAITDSGAIIKFNENTLTVENNNLKAFDFDAEDCPDLFPPLTALAVFCQGKTKIHGVSRLFNKESNRAETLQKEFRKLGIKIYTEKNFLIIEGNKIIPSSVNSNNDHRIAMALALASIKASHKFDIENHQAVNKSYPDFFSDLLKIAKY